jgi:hypothetical protein
MKNSPSNSASETKPKPKSIVRPSQRRLRQISLAAYRSEKSGAGAQGSIPRVLSAQPALHVEVVPLEVDPHGAARGLETGARVVPMNADGEQLVKQPRLVKQCDCPNKQFLRLSRSASLSRRFASNALASRSSETTFSCSRSSRRSARLLEGGLDHGGRERGTASHVHACAGDFYHSSGPERFLDICSGEPARLNGLRCFVSLCERLSGRTNVKLTCLYNERVSDNSGRIPFDITDALHSSCCCHVLQIQYFRREPDEDVDGELRIQAYRLSEKLVGLTPSQSGCSLRLS